RPDRLDGRANGPQRPAASARPRRREGGGVSYAAFLESKFHFSKAWGFEVADSDVNPMLFGHQREIVRWAVKKGRAAIFAAFGLGKSVIQLETCRLVLREHGAGRALIIAPLGVRQEFKRDAEKLGIGIRFVRRSEEVREDGFYITNYESV